MPRPKALVTRALLPDAIDIIRDVADVEVWPDEAPPSVSELQSLAANADGILTTIMDRVDVALLDAAPNLRVISQLAVGLDNVDVAEATRRRIPVGYTPGVLAKSTADLAFALLLGAARRTSESERWLRGGGWQIQFHPTHWLGQDVHEACLGIVGLGQIGRKSPAAPGASTWTSSITPAPDTRMLRPSTASAMWSFPICWPRPIS